MSEQRKILLLAQDPVPASRRKVALDRAGYTTLATTALTSAGILLPKFRPDLVILGERVRDLDAGVLLQQCRQWGVRTLAIVAPGQKIRLESDHEVHVHQTDKELVDYVRGIFAGDHAVTTAEQSR